MTTPVSAPAEGKALAIRTKDAAPQRKQQKQKKQPSDNAAVPAKSPKLKSKSKPQVPNGVGSKPEITKAVNRNSASAAPTGPITTVPQKSIGEKKKKRKVFPRAGGKVGIAGSGEIATKNESFPTLAPTPAPNWKLSPFLGGRYAKLDPVFTKDEKHLLVAQALSLKIYSIKTSLLVRTITVQASNSAHTTPEHVVSYFIDPKSDDRVYIATSNSQLYLYDLTTGKQFGNPWKLALGPLRHVCVCPDQKLESSESEVVYAVSQLLDDSYSVWRVTLSGPKVGGKAMIYSTRNNITRLHAADAGRAVCLIAAREIVVLNREGTEWHAPRVYKMANPLTCMDIQVSDMATSKKPKKNGGRRRGDIVVGDNAGALYVLHDVIKYSKVETDHTPRKLHWHRMAVSSVKFALDGAYIVSGGTETVLVIWQLETGHKQFLPHLGAGINSIVVSPRGASYAVNLSDNSVMVLSTSELKPKANIAGIQSHAQSRRNRESRVVPCLLHPTKANNLLIATPSNQLDQHASSPYLQTFDTYSDRHVSRQALTRTNATILNQGPDKAFISEPDITFLAATSDGHWLASVDEWQPLKRDEVSQSLNMERKREVFLRFWRWSEARKEWELITRVDSPHPSPEEMGTESIFDLIAAPNGHTFVTAGADGCVKIWKPKVRARPGATAAPENQITWGLRKSINFTKRRHEEGESLPLVLAGEAEQPQKSWGNVAFSEDSSVLAVSSPDAGFGSHEDSLIHLIDPTTGSIRQTLGGLQIGRTTGLAIIDRYLVASGSQKLLVWNLVHSRVEWSYTITELLPALFAPTLHLAVDHKERTIAVAATISNKRSNHGKILVWKDVADPTPACIHNLESAVSALRSAGPGKGFFVVDTQARIQYLTPVFASHASVASIVASGQTVEAADEETARALSGMYIADTNGEVDAMDVDDGEAEIEKVVAREKLEEVFDAFETYEQGAVHVAFEQVLGLFAKRPLGDDDEEVEEVDAQGEESESEEESEEDDEDQDME